MESDDQSKKALPRKESSDERQRMESDDQSKKALPRKESSDERQRMESDDQSKKIFVKMTKTIAVNVTNTDTIDSIKTKVQEMEGIASSKQKLFFGLIRLKGTQILDYYNIPANSCIDLYVKDGITISIQTFTKSISLNVKSSDTVSNIKAMIHDKEGIPSDQQTLIFSWKMLDEDQTLASYGVHNNAVIQMLIRPSSTLHVTVKFIPDSAINLEVQSWYTIAQLKLIIGLPQDGRLKLFCSDQELLDKETLCHYKINDYAVIEVKPALMRIFVRTLERDTIEMNVDECEKLSDVAVRIGERLNLNPVHFAIRYMERYLLNSNSTVFESCVELLNRDSTVGESGIRDDSTLDLVQSITHRDCQIL